MGLLGEDHPGGIGADMPGDTRQDVDPRARVEVEVELGGGRPDRPVRRERERRRAERDRVDPQQEVVHDRIADDRQLEDVRTGMPPVSASPAIEAVERLATARVISPAPSSCIIAYETRLMRSSPNRIWGFMTPLDARTAPSARSARCPAIVVEPMSIATP